MAAVRSTGNMLPPPTKDGTPEGKAGKGRNMNFSYSGPFETPNAWAQWERDVMLSPSRVKYAVFRNRRTGSIFEIDYNSTGSLSFNEKYTEAPWFFYANGEKVRSKWGCPKLVYEMERKMRVGNINLSEEEEALGQWTAKVRGSMMSVSNVLPGRDPAVCLHIILLHDSFIFVSEQQSVNLPRHALVCKGGVQLREYPGGVKAALALIGLEEKVVIVEGPRVDDPMNILARLKLAQNAEDEEGDPVPADMIGCLRRALQYSTTLQKRQEACSYEFLRLPAHVRAAAVNSVEADYLSHLLMFGHVSEHEYERLTNAIRASPEFPAAALNQDDAPFMSQWLDPVTRQRLPQLHFRAWEKMSWGEKLHAARVAQAKMDKGVDLYDAEADVEGLGVDQLAKIRKSDQAVANMGVPEEELSSDEEFDLMDLGAEDSELAPDMRRHPLYKALLAGETAKGMTKVTRQKLEQLAAEKLGHKGNDIQQFYEECDVCGRRCDIAGSGMCNRCRKFEDDRFKYGFTEDTTRPGTYLGDSRGLLGHPGFEGYVVTRPPANRSKQDKSMFALSMEERRSTLESARSSARVAMAKQDELERAAEEDRRQRRAEHAERLKGLEQDSRVVKAYDATGVSVAASLMGPPQQHEIDAFLSMVRNNHYDKVKDLLLRSSLQFMTDGGMGILYTKDEHGNTPIIVAAQQGHKKLIKMLVQAGSDVNVQNLAGNTALHYAIMYKHGEVAEMLMRSGADEALPNRHGQMPFDMEGGSFP